MRSLALSIVVLWLQCQVAFCSDVTTTTQDYSNVETEANLDVIITENTENVGVEPADFESVVVAYQKAKSAYSSERGENRTQSARDNWRSLSFQKKIQHLYNNSRLTDVTFTVGEDGKTEDISAHSIVLAISSPVFDYALLGDDRAFRIANITGDEFRQIMMFMYTGDLCVSSFEEACALLKHASYFGLEGAVDIARRYIFSMMYPKHIWHAYQCAKQVADKMLMDTAWMLIMRKTDEAVGDPKFNEISQSDLVDLLSRDDLAISKEYHLYQAVVRWALVQASKKGLEKTPEGLREVIGAEALKQVRFLNMTMEEFRDVYIGFRILTYEEVLATIFNKLDYGSVSLPDTLSSINHSRVNVADRKNETIQVFGMKESCAVAENGSLTSPDDIYSALTTTVVPKSYSRARLLGIQIPKSYQARANCTSVKEHFDVFVLDQFNNVLHKTTYNQVPPCSATRYYPNSYSSWYAMQDETLISVNLNRFGLDNLSQATYKIKVVFRDDKTYPATHQVPTQSYLTTYYQHDFFGTSGNHWYMQQNSFIYTIVLDSSY